MATLKLSDDEVFEAARIAEIAEFVIGLPDQWQPWSVKAGIVYLVGSGNG